MLKRIRLLLNKTNNITRSSYLWNSINAMLSAAESAVILMVMNRTNGLYDSGVFSIAFAISSLMMFVGQYGVRRFQSSDIHEKYSFGVYYAMRYISCIVMMLSSFGYCVYGTICKDYNTVKFLVIMLICFVRCIQAFSDVFHGRMQQKGRLDVATKCSAVRYVAEMASYCIMLVITRDLLISTLACAITSLVVFLVTSMNAAVDYCDMKVSMDLPQIRKLTIEAFPLFVSLFLNMYLSNAPKYAIDTYLTEEIQAKYNLIFMPAFVVQLVAHFIFNPILTSYAEVWVKGELRTFVKLVLRQMLVILGLAVFGLGVAATIGIPVLSLVFCVDLSDYKRELCIVMLGGGMLAYSVFFNTVITIIRLHRTLIACYGLAAIAAFAFSGYFVRTYGMLGATVLYAIIMTVLTLSLGIILLWGLLKARREGTTQ